VCRRLLLSVLITVDGFLPLRTLTIPRAGEGVAFASLFAADGVLAYPFALPGQPPELPGRDAIRAHFAGLGHSRGPFALEGVHALVRETDDPEVVVTEITHHGRSKVTGEPYRFTALGVIRVSRR
jgi:uncharacterized protein